MKKFVLGLMVLSSLVCANDVELMSDTKEDELAIEVWKQMKNQIQTDPYIDSYIKIIDSNLLKPSTIKNTLSVDIKKIEEEEAINRKLTDADLSYLAKNLKSSNIESICLEPNLLKLVKEGVSFIYTYVANDNGVVKPLIEINVNKKVCDNYGVYYDSSTGMSWQDNKEAITVQKPWVTQANYDAENYMDTSGDTATTYCENLTLGGHSDWRLPTMMELVSLDANKEGLIYYEGIVYWSSTTCEGDNYCAKLLIPFGRNGTYSKYVSHHVRCVRAGQ